MKRTPTTARIYFSLRSPFSWLSLRALEATRPDILHTSTLIPFWDPAPETLTALQDLGGRYHYTQMSRAKHLYILQDAKRISARLGLSMVWPVDRAPRWEIPHLAWLAAEPAQRTAVYHALMEARWCRGDDICDQDVVADVLARADVDAELAHAHKDETVVAQGVQMLMGAYRDDIFGIPYFKCGSQRFWGLERVGWFVACHDRWRETGTFSQPEAPAAVAMLDALAESFDSDAPGGCG
jgi:2-hydroxychromene-2-carboxylate isomerase